jgi:hypothetical protein
MATDQNFEDRRTKPAFNLKAGLSVYVKSGEQPKDGGRFDLWNTGRNIGVSMPGTPIFRDSLRIRQGVGVLWQR